MVKLLMLILQRPTLMQQPEFRNDIFSTPVWIGGSGDDDTRASIEALSYAFKKRQEGKETGLVSEEWNKQTKTTDESAKAKNGITSFFSENLVFNDDWTEAGQFLLNMAGTMLSDTHDVGGMKLGNMWTTIYPQGGFVPEHIHSCFSVSGVYYVKAEPDCGEIVFKDPAWVAKTMNIWGGNETFPHGNTSFVVDPKPGMMILFPSWLPHSTKSNKSGEDRIIVSFNLDFGEVNRNQQLHSGITETEARE